MEGSEAGEALAVPLASPVAREGPVMGAAAEEAAVLRVEGFAERSSAQNPRAEPDAVGVAVAPMEAMGHTETGAEFAGGLKDLQSSCH